MQISNAGLKCVARGSLKNTGCKQRPKNCHLGTIVQLCAAVSSQLTHVLTIEKPVKQQYLLHMSSQYGDLRPINGWDRFVILGHLRKFQRVLRLGFVTAVTSSLNGSQPNFARCFAISCAGTLYIYTFSGALAPWQNFASCKMHVTSKSWVLLYWQRYCTALQRRASAKLCGVVQGTALRNFCSGRHY